MTTSAPSHAWRISPRAIVAVALTLLIGAMSVITSPLAAHAATGDYTITLDAPNTVNVGETYNYAATLQFEGVDAANPAVGVQLSTTLPAGTAFDSMPTGADSPVASYTYDPATRVLTIVLKDTTNPLLTIVYTAKQTDLPHKYLGEELTTVMTGSGGPSGNATSETVTTTVQGDNDYFAAKTSEVVTGGDNRTVTYHFDMATSHPDTHTTFTSWMQELSDSFPAGAVLVEASPSFQGGSWDTTAWPNAKWTRDGAYGPSNTSFDPSKQRIWLTVYYPATVAGWEDGKRPPVNTVTLNTADVNDVTHVGTPGTTQGPAFTPTGGVAVGASKTDAGGRSAGQLVHSTQTGGSYVGPASSPDLDSLVLTDSGAAGEANESWFKHADISQIFVTFSTSLAAQNLPYKLEYQIDGSSAWTEYTGYAVSSGRTNQSLTLAVQNAGSTGWRANGQDVLNIPVGSTLTGWRLSVAPGAETVKVGSEAKVRMSFQPVFRETDAGVQGVDAAAGVSPGPQTNTVTVTADDQQAQASSSYTPTDSVFVTTHVTAPSSLSVGSSGTISAGIVNQNPSETYTDSMLTVLLPCGVFYDAAQAITPAPSTIGVPATPAIGAGATVDSTGRITDANGCEQQVVKFSFDELPAMRAPGTVNDRWAESFGWTYDIPVRVLAQAYDPDATSVVSTSFATVADPRLIAVADGGTATATVPMVGYNPFFGNDVYDLDPARTSVAVAKDNTTINTAGGLLISKLSGASATGPWALNSVVSDDSFWQIYVSNVLPNPVTNIAFFDKLPSVADGDDFDTQLSAAVTGAPAGAVVEYSTDATTATNGTWTMTAAGATAFRVTVPSMTSGDKFTLVVPTSNLGDLSYGELADNTVSATGTYNSNPVSFSSNSADVTVLASPALAIVKKTNGVAYDAAPGAVVAKGSPVTWTYEVTNTGDAPLDSVAVSDEFVDGSGATGTLTPTSSATGQLLPGETRTFTATGIAVAGQYHNTATATGTAVTTDGTALPQQPAPATDESWYLAGVSGLTIVKTTNGEDVESAPGLPLKPGADVEWKYTVTNTGTLPLTEILVKDVDADGNSVFTDTVASLAPGESVTLSQAGTAVEGQYHNTVTATAEDPAGSGQPLTAADDSWYFGNVRGLSVEKLVSDSADGPWDETVEIDKNAASYWKVTVTNTGNSTLNDVTLTDAKLDQTIAVGTLAAGESKTVILSMEKTTEGFTNVADASGTSVDGSEVDASDDASVAVTEQTAPPTVPEEPVIPGIVEPNGSIDPKALAVTGFAASGFMTVAGLLITGGLLMLRRRKTAQQ